MATGLLTASSYIEELLHIKLEGQTQLISVQSDSDLGGLVTMATLGRVFPGSETIQIL